MITMIWSLWWWSYRSHIQQAQYLAMTWRLEASLPTDHLRPSLFKIVPWLYPEKMYLCSKSYRNCTFNKCTQHTYSFDVKIVCQTNVPSKIVLSKKWQYHPASTFKLNPTCTAVPCDHIQNCTHSVASKDYPRYTFDAIFVPKLYLKPNMCFWCHCLKSHSVCTFDAHICHCFMQIATLNVDENFLTSALQAWLF